MGRERKNLPIPDGYVLINRFAEQVGRTRNAAMKAVREGRITKYVELDGRVYIDAVAGAEEWADNNSPVVGGIGGRDRLRAHAGNRVGVGDTDNEMVDHGETLRITELRRRKLEISNAIEMHKLRALAGIVVEKSVVEARLFEMGQLFRAKMQQIPAAVVDAVMAARTRNAAMLEIENGINEALNALADEIEKGI